MRSNTPPLPPLPTSFVAIKCVRSNEPTTNNHTGLHKFNHTDRPAPLPHPLTLESPNSTLSYLAHHGHHATILPNATTVSAATALSPTICSTSLSTFQPVAPHHFNSLDYRERNQTHYKHGQGGHQSHYREPTHTQRNNTLDRRSAGAATSNASGCMGDYNQISPHYLQTFDSLDPYGVANLHLYRSQSKSQIYGRGSTASGSGSGSNDGSTHDAVLYHSNSTLNHYQQHQQQQQQSEQQQHYQSGNGSQRSQQQTQHHHHSLKHSKSGGSKSHKSKASAHQQQQQQHLTQQQQQKPTKSRSSRSLQQQQQSSATDKSGKMTRGSGKERKHNNNCNAINNTAQINNISKANSMTSQYSSSSESMHCDNNYY